MTEIPDRLSAALAERYPIEQLGGGGMATVYLAKDLEHERQVALKVLEPERTRAIGSQRFRREITITAGLSHPHVLLWLEAGEADGVLYYVMPIVSGESLADRVTARKQLPLNDALDITCEVGGALIYFKCSSARGQQGVVHSATRLLVQCMMHYEMNRVSKRC